MAKSCNTCRFVELKPCNGICFYCDPASKDKWMPQYVDLDAELAVYKRALEKACNKIREYTGSSCDSMPKYYTDQARKEVDSDG